MAQSNGGTNGAALEAYESACVQAARTGSTRTGSSASLTFEQTIAEVGIGRVQWMLLLICGLTFCSDAAEVTFLSYVTEVLKCEWGLTSKEESSISSAVFVGMIIGSPFWGVVADKLGRRPAFLLSSLIITTFGFITAMSKNFIQLLAFRAIVGFGVSGLPVAFDVLAEALPAEGRGKFLLYIEYFWTFGSIYVNICAWAMLETLGWQVFTAMAAIPTLIASIAALVALPESPRWLLNEGRESEALKILNSWRKANRSKCGKIEAVASGGKSEEQASIVDLLTTRRLRRSFFCMAVVWFAFGVAYYGIVMLLPRIFASNSEVGACTVDFDFKDLAIASFAEIVGVVIAICIIDNPGRTWSQGFFYSLCGVCAFLLGFRSLGRTSLTVIASLGRFAEMGASCATWVHTPELFPTELRALAHGMLNLMSKIGATLAPFLISDLFTQWQCASIMGGVSVSAAMFAMCLPETSGKDIDNLSEDGSSAAEDSVGESSDSGSDSFRG